MDSRILAVSLFAVATACVAADDPAATALPTLDALQPWTGDLDGMVQRRTIRALVPYSKTLYFVDKGAQRGLAYEYMQEFEAALNKERATGNLRINVVFVPTARDQM